MAEYKLTIHKDSEHETAGDAPNKVQATIVVSFDNPKYEEPKTEKRTIVEPVLEEDGSAKIDPKDNTVITEEVEREVTIESEEPKTLEFTQEIFIPIGEKEQKKVAQAYADDYEKGFVAQGE